MVSSLSKVEALTMEKISTRIWVLLAGIIVAIVIAISAIALDRPTLQSKDRDSKPPGSKTTVPAIFKKAIHTVLEAPRPLSH